MRTTEIILKKNENLKKRLSNSISTITHCLEEAKNNNTFSDQLSEAIEEFEKLKKEFNDLNPDAYKIYPKGSSYPRMSHIYLFDIMLNSFAIEESKKSIKEFDETIIPALDKINETRRALVGLFVKNDPAGIICSYEMPKFRK